MIYIINCPCCGLRITENAPEGIVEESNLVTVCESMRSKRGGAWTSIDADLEDVIKFLSNSEALGITDNMQAEINAIYEKAVLLDMGRYFFNAYLDEVQEAQMAADATIRAAVLKMDC
ncbi:MAG: hypothetical protein ACRC7P_07905 [Enterovibrio sp.]